MQGFTARRTPRTLWAQAPIRGKALRFSPDPFCRFRDTASAFADDPLNYGGLRSAPAARLRPAGYAVASSGRHFTRGLAARGHSVFFLTSKKKTSLAPCALAGGPLATTVCVHRSVNGAFKRFLRGQTAVCRPSSTTQVRGLQPRPSDRSDRSDKSDTAAVFMSVARVRYSVAATTVCEHRSVSGTTGRYRNRPFADFHPPHQGAGSSHIRRTGRTGRTGPTGPTGPTRRRLCPSRPRARQRAPNDRLQTAAANDRVRAQTRHKLSKCRLVLPPNGCILYVLRISVVGAGLFFG